MAHPYVAAIRQNIQQKCPRNLVQMLGGARKSETHLIFADSRTRGPVCLLGAVNAAQIPNYNGDFFIAHYDGQNRLEPHGSVDGTAQPSKAGAAHTFDRAAATMPASGKDVPPACQQTRQIGEFNARADSG